MNRCKRFAPLAFSIALLGMPLVAADAATKAPPLLTLAQAQKLALARHPNLRATAFDRAAASEAVKIARSSYAPQASGTFVQAVAPGGTRIGAYTAISDPTIVQRTAAGVGVSQYISDFGRTRDLVRASELELRAQSEQDDATRDQVLLAVAQTYFEVLRAEALLDVANATVRERSTLLREIEILQRAGLRSTLDVSIARHDASEANAAVITARAERFDAFASLAEAIGTPIDRIYRLENLPTLPKLPSTLDTFVGEALAASPLLGSLEATAAADAERAKATARLTSPTITGYGFFGVSPFKESNVALASPYATAGVALTVPIFTGGSLAAQRREAEDVANAAASRTLEERNELVRDVRAAFEAVREAQSTIAVDDQVLRAAQQTFTLTQTRYRLGLSSISDLSIAQLEEEQAAIARTNATYDFVAQISSLQYVAGVIAGQGVAPHATTPSGEMPESGGDDAVQTPEATH